MDRASEITRHLFSLHTRGIRYDLDRMKRAVSMLGNPEHACPCFHVAGTNGKGSVCSYLEAMLRRSGVKTGLYTSPHLVGFEERFVIDGRPVHSSAWIDVYDALTSIIESLHLTFFEASTLMAFELFRRQGVEWAVYETGLGGRLDATNVVMPRVSLITAIDLDHCDLLGTSLADVAVEKLGIVKHRTPLVMSMPRSAGVRDLALIHALRNETSAEFVEPSEAQQQRREPDGVSFEWRGERFHVNARGRYQVENLLLALHGLAAAGFTTLGAMGRGLSEVRIPGRFQVETVRGKTVVFDVGHNPHAARSFCAELVSLFPGKRICCVAGIMKDKEIRPMIASYAAVADRMLFCAPGVERAAPLQRLMDAVPASFRGETLACDTVVAAVDTACNGQDDIVCVTGSFYTVGEAMQALGVAPYPASNPR